MERRGNGDRGAVSKVKVRVADAITVIERSALRYGDGFYQLWFHCRTFAEKRRLIRYWRARPQVRWP